MALRVFWDKNRNTFWKSNIFPSSYQHPMNSDLSSSCHPQPHFFYCFFLHVFLTYSVDRNPFQNQGGKKITSFKSYLCGACVTFSNTQLIVSQLDIYSTFESLCQTVTVSERHFWLFYFSWHAEGFITWALACKRFFFSYLWFQNPSICAYPSQHLPHSQDLSKRLLVSLEESVYKNHLMGFR